MYTASKKLLTWLITGHFPIVSLLYVETLFVQAEGSSPEQIKDKLKRTRDKHQIVE